MKQRAIKSHAQKLRRAIKQLDKSKKEIDNIIKYAPYHMGSLYTAQAKKRLDILKIFYKREIAKKIY